METKDLEVLRPFGPTIAKVKIPDNLVKELNDYTDDIIKNKTLIKKLTKDKKNFLNNINFSLIDKIGSSIFYKKLDKNKVYKILKNI